MSFFLILSSLGAFSFPRTASHSCLLEIRCHSQLKLQGNYKDHVSFDTSPLLTELVIESPFSKLQVPRQWSQLIKNFTSLEFRVRWKSAKWEGSFSSSIVLYKMFPLQGYGKGTALCLLLLLRHTFMTVPVVPFFSSSPDFKCHPISPNLSQISTPAVPTSASSWESAIFMWKWRDSMRLRCSKCYCRAEAAPGRERKGARRKQRPVWTCARQGELFLSTSWRAGSGREDEGYRVVKLAWKFPTCTTFLMALFSTTFY